MFEQKFVLWSGLLNQSFEGMSLIHTCSTPQMVEYHVHYHFDAFCHALWLIRLLYSSFVPKRGSTL